MQTFTFSGYRDGITAVRARDEAQARHLAMVARWGLPRGSDSLGRTSMADTYRQPYQGAGLILVSVE